MKMVMFSNLRRFRPFAVAGMVLLGSLLLITSNMLSTTVSAAVTESQCYDLNGKTYNTNIPNTNRQAQTECIAAGYCKEVKSGNVAGVTSCSRTIYETSDQYKASQAASESGQVQVATMAPAQRVICGGLPTNAQLQDEYNSCASTFQSHYTQCTDNAERRYSPAEDQVTAAIATCLAGYYPSANSDNLTAAVTQGRADGTTKAEEIAADKVAAAQAVCAEKKMTYSPNSEGVDADGCIAGAATDAPKCTGGPLGWFLCPVLELLQKANTAIAEGMESQLFVTLASGSTSGESYADGIRPLWGMIVTVANLFLVVAFLIVIFSQATSMGLSAYGIKKMLPRIIAAAILINLSFFICSIALDVVNVIGAAVKSMLTAGIQQVRPIEGAMPESYWGWFVAADIGAAVLGVVGAWMIGVIGFLVPIALAVVGGLMVLFIGMAFRKVLIVLLVIVAPLAFAAMVLPGTESLFKKWMKSYMGLLIMYPVIMAIMYGSALVANVILKAGGF